MKTQNSEHSAKFNFFLCISFCTCWAMTELYGLLGLSPNGPVTAADIRSAYLRNALQAHPDKAGSKEPGATRVHWANLTCIYVEHVSWMACWLHETQQASSLQIFVRLLIAESLWSPSAASPWDIRNEIPTFQWCHWHPNMLEERFQQLLAAVALLSDMTGVLPRCCERGIESSCVHTVPILSHTLLLDIKVSKFYQQDSHRHVSF